MGPLSHVLWSQVSSRVIFKWVTVPERVMEISLNHHSNHCIYQIVNRHLVRPDRRNHAPLLTIHPDVQSLPKEVLVVASKDLNRVVHRSHHIIILVQSANQIRTAKKDNR